jgi:hypothetical protein
MHYGNYGPTIRLARGPVGCTAKVCLVHVKCYIFHSNNTANKQHLAQPMHIISADGWTVGRQGPGSN